MERVQKLFKAVKANNHQQIELFAAEEDADINVKNEKSFTILHMAAWKGHLESVKVILKCQGDPNAVGLGGSTPLHYAAKFGHFIVVVELLSNGAIHDPRSVTGNTPLNLCMDQAIKELLTTIKSLFSSVEKKPSTLIVDLNKIKDKAIAKADSGCSNCQMHKTG